MPSSASATLLTIPADVVFEVLDGEAVVLHLKSGTYFTLDPVGTRMWQLIAEHGDLEKVRSAMLVEYSVEPRLLEVDLEKLVSGLLEKGLVLSSEGGS